MQIIKLLVKLLFHFGITPFPLLASVDQDIDNDISTLVKTVIEKKKLNENSNTTDLENQIDQLVYRIYELTEEEIAIIENSTK